MTDAFDGVGSMAVWMDSDTDTERLIVLETGATNRFIEYSLVDGSTSRVWNGIQAGSNGGWVFDPFNTSFGWVVHSRPRGDFEKYKEDGPPFRHARGDLIKFQLDANDYGDFKQVEVFSGLCTPLRIGDLCAESSTTIGHCGECGHPAFVQVKGHTYLVFQHLDKAVFKYNASAKHPKDMFRPSAGFVSLYTNNTVGSEKIDKVLWAWHDADNSGSWLLPDWTSDFAELGAPVPEGTGVGGIKGWGMMGRDRVQDDLSFVGPSKMGFWIWDVVGFDAFDNPIYDPKGARILLNDSIVQSRYLYNDSATHPSPNPCPSCKGLPQTHGGNEIAGEVDMRSAGVFVNSSHEHFVAALGHAGSQWTGGFSADSAPQYKLAWYAKDEAAKTG